MVHILTGQADSLHQAAMARLKASYEAGNSVMLLVPEQITLQTERDALNTLQVKGFFRVQVLSPTRLATFVFDRAGQDPRVMIDERGQTMTLSRALWDLKDELHYYARARTRPGFAQKLAEAISEIKSTGISPEDFGAWLDAQEAPHPKFKDLAALYAAYETAMEGQLADSQDKEREMLSRLMDSDLFRGHDIIVHGFDLLTQPIIRLLSALSLRARGLLVTLLMDRAGGAGSDAFAPVQASGALLTKELQKLGVPCQWDTATGGERTRKPDLAHLKEQLLRIRQEPYPGPAEGLRIFAGKTPHEEMRRAAQMIHTQLTQGTDPRDIAVFMAQEAYAPLLRSVLTDYDIPHFVAVKEPILAQPLVRCLLDALTCIQAAAWRPPDVFSYLKSPYAPLGPSEAFQLENYARAYGIRGKRWTEPFTRGEEAERSAMEALRLIAITPVLTLRQGLHRARSAAQSIDAVLAFLRDIKAQERVSQLDGQLTDRGMLEEAQRARQVWEQLMGLLAQMNQLLGDTRIPLGRFAEWLRAGLSQTGLSALPPMQHCVQAGMLGQLMTSAPKAVYILGLNQGALNLSMETLIKDREREQLESALDIRLNLKRQDRESIRLVDLWKAMGAPSEALHLSYALSDDQGRALSPLIELGRIQRMFPLLVAEGGALYNFREHHPYTPAVALDEIAVLMRKGEMTEGWWQAWAWLLTSEAWQQTARGILPALAGDDPDKALGPQAARVLHQAGVTSVSRLESYAACPFRHFVDYGLRPRERREWALQSQDLGSFYHDAMDAFVRRVKDRPDWQHMTREESRQEMDQVLAELTQGWEEAPWADTKRARSNARRAMDICRRMAWALTEGRARSAFRPQESEMVFGPGAGHPPIGITLKDGSLLTLRGVIDRLDIALTQEEELLLRIIDYKSGINDLRGGDLEAGAQLQLMLYLRAALDLMPEAVPAGAFYQRLTDPMVRAEDENRAAVLGNRALQLVGVALAEPGVLRLMDDGTPPLTLPRHLKVDGSLKDSPRLLTRAELDTLMDLARDRARELAENIFRGIIRRSPLITGDGRAACQFCQYQGICRTEKIQAEPLKRRSRKINLKDLAREKQGQAGP